MLSLLISGTLGNDIDVFLAPLVDDLQILFDNGVETYDAYVQERFNLRLVVLWMINDYHLLVHHLVFLTAGSKNVLCVANKHTVLDSLNQISKVMMVTNAIYRMTTHLEDKRGHSMENKISYHRQYL